MKILFLQKRLLFPTDSGGKIRTLNVIRHLAKWHHVVYLSNLLEQEKPYCRQMEALGVELITIDWSETRRWSAKFFWDLAANLFSPFPFNVNKDYDPRVRARLSDLLGDAAFDLLVCDFVQMARNCQDVPGPARVLFQHNVEAEIFERHAEVDRGWLRRLYMAEQARKMRRFEKSAGHDFDAVVAVSKRDQQMFQNRYGWDHVVSIDTSVDTAFFSPQDVPSDPQRVVFVGSLDWLPNIDGVRYFVEAIWPSILSECPDARFHIVGKNPGPETLRLGETTGVTVVGGVPDVRPELSRAAVAVVPLRIGGGTRLKIYEAMAMGKPVVSTPLGAEGLTVNPGQDSEIADDPAEFAQRVSGLLQDAALREAMGRRARELVVENYGSETVARQFESVCLRAAQRDLNRRPSVASNSGE